MRFFKIIDIEKNVILKAVKDQDIICMKKTLSGQFIATKKLFSSDDYAICVDNIIYIIADKGYDDLDYKKVKLIMLSLNEFNELQSILAQSIQYDTIEQEEVIIAEDTSTLNTAALLKINELKSACNSSITSGIDIHYSEKLTKHFDLTVEDQLNLNALRYQLITSDQDTFAYHSKNDDFEYYNRKEIEYIIASVDKHILYHTVYFNSLKKYVSSLTAIDEINAIKYGQDFPDMYKSQVLLEISDK